MSERVFLSGPMGSGKTAVAAALSDLWQTPAYDLDALVEQRTGLAIAELFRTRGEAGFRAIERELLKEQLALPDVRILSLGGGTVVDTESRRALLSTGTLITLTGTTETLLRRVRSGKGRPLLDVANPAKAIEQIVALRRAAYAECHAQIATDERTVEELAQAIDRVVTEAPLVVPLGERTYRVEVFPGVRHELVPRLRTHAPGGVVVVVTDTGVDDSWARRARESLEAASLTCVPVCLEAGEAHKHIGSVERIWDAALDAGVDRDGFVLAVGGGVVGDMAAFAASTLLRGVGLGQLPTTLLSMVDSAVGGKTGIDRRQGKNLVGTFHQPKFVLCDVETLATLPLAERRAGLAEVVKSAWLAGEAEVCMLERAAQALVDGELEATSDAVRMSVQLKAKIVTEDELETGSRALLNLGHTVGHAIEAQGGFSALRHGEAVALGMVAAFKLAVRLGTATQEQAERMTALLRALGLPTAVEPHLNPATLAYIGSDKKRRAGKVRFIAPGAPGKTQIVPLSVADAVGHLLA
jgi:shikimate kinase/3-dehydroquinate synthase